MGCRPRPCLLVLPNVVLAVAAVLGGVKYGAHDSGMSSRSIFGPGVLVLPPSRAGYKYGALSRWFARQRQPSP